MIKKEKKSDIILVAGLAVVCLVIKISCFVVWQKIEYPNDLPLILLSCTYYIMLGVLCFFCGKMKGSSIIAAIVLVAEMLMPLIAVLCKGPAFLGPAYFLVAASWYALTELIHSVENVGQTINDCYYLTVWMVAQLLFLGILLISRRFWAKHNLKSSMDSPTG